MFKKQVVVDAKGHLSGRLASYVAKELLKGQRVVVVRAEKLLISGSLFRNKTKYMQFLNKRMSTNPKKGPIHHRAPSRVFWRVVRGMLPHKTPKGAAALGRLKCFDGVPLTYNQKKKVVVSDALKVVRLKPRSRFCVLGDVVAQCGWTKGEILAGYETKRQARNHEWHLKRVEKDQRNKKALKQNGDYAKITKELEQYGY